MYRGEDSLLDVLAFKADCCYLSDLCYLYANQERRERMVNILMDISIDDFSIFEWNDALIYLTGMPGMNHVELIKDTLIGYLRT